MAYSGQLGSGISILLLPLSRVDNDRPTSLSMLPLAQTLLTLIPGRPPSRVHRTTVPCVENRFPDVEQFLALSSRWDTLHMILLGAWKLNGVGPLTPSPSMRTLDRLTWVVLLMIGLCMLHSMPLSPADPPKRCTGAFLGLRDGDAARGVGVRDDGACGVLVWLLGPLGICPGRVGTLGCL